MLHDLGVIAYIHEYVMPNIICVKREDYWGVVLVCPYIRTFMRT